MSSSDDETRSSSPVYVIAYPASDDGAGTPALAAAIHAGASEAADDDALPVSVTTMTKTRRPRAAPRPGHDSRRWVFAGPSGPAALYLLKPVEEAGNAADELREV